jgi:hypothetical protein
MFMDSENIARLFLILALILPAALRTPEKAQQQAIQKTSNGPLVKAVTPTLGPIDPHVVAGGGGTSAGSSFVLDGTIGQSPAVPSMNGGTFSMTSGFWPSTGDVVVAKKRRGQVTSQ